MASETLTERPQAGPDTMTRIIMLLTRDSVTTSRERTVEPSNITATEFSGKGLQMQEGLTINSIYIGILKTQRLTHAQKAPRQNPASAAAASLRFSFTPIKRVSASVTSM